MAKYDLVLAFGAEKMTHPDKRRAVLVVATALDLGEGLDERSVSPFMDVYAAKVRTYLRDIEATWERISGRVVVKAQGNGLLNPLAQYGGHVTVEQVLADPVISTH